jgi:hypothetical protein
MSQPIDTFNPLDPTGMWKGMRDAGMDAWSKMMIQLVNTEAYAQATGALLDAWLSGSAPFRKALEKAMTQALINLNMPTRTDVISLGAHLTNIETRLDDLMAKLEEGQRAANAPMATPPAAHGQTRRSGRGATATPPSTAETQP